MSKKHLILILILTHFVTEVVATTVPHFASGVKVGEVDQNSAIIWTRLTEKPKANFSLDKIFTEGLKDAHSKDKDYGFMPTEVVPGKAGEVRLRYWFSDQSPKMTNWVKVSAQHNFVHQFKLKDLFPNTNYQFVAEARVGSESKSFSVMKGSFKTAPEKEKSVPIRFVVTTCQAIRSIDSGTEGHVVYKNMLNFDPHFFVHTGDILYYDKAPLCQNVAQARAKWDLMFSYQHNKNFHRQVSSYFMKDDHDTLKNDCWAGQTYYDLTFAQGLAIFKENVPMGKKTYRRIRWGKDVEVWLTENRDYRSANNLPDGPEKTILGQEQKAWLKKTVSESDATYKFIISPGPIVGPDKKGKKDNHANQVFFHEGQELRDFISQQKNTYVICGDRHWQYYSIDPKTKVRELGCGPINDEHSFGGNSGHQPEYHQYFSGEGGFLGITVEGGQAKAQWFHADALDQKTNLPKVRFETNL